MNIKTCLFFIGYIVGCLSANEHEKSDIKVNVNGKYVNVTLGMCKCCHEK